MLNLGVRNFVKYIVVMGCVLVFGKAGAATTLESTCTMATKIGANSSTWSAGYNEVEIFSVDVTNTGILVLDVSAGSTADGPRMIFLGRGCAELGSAEDFAAVEQSAAYQVIAIRAPGTYSLRLASAGIGRMLGDYELRSSFTPAEIVDKETVMELPGKHRILAQHTHLLVNQIALKSDLEVVNPNPDGIISVDPFKSDLEVVNPNPDGVALESDLSAVLSLVTMISQPSGTVMAKFVLFPGESKSGSKTAVGLSDEPNESSFSPLEQFLVTLQSAFFR